MIAPSNSTSQPEADGILRRASVTPESGLSGGQQFSVVLFPVTPASVRDSYRALEAWLSIPESQSLACGSLSAR